MNDKSNKFMVANIALSNMWRAHEGAGTQLFCL